MSDCNDCPLQFACDAEETIAYFLEHIIREGYIPDIRIKALDCEFRGRSDNQLHECSHCLGFGTRFFMDAGACERCNGKGFVDAETTIKYSIKEFLDRKLKIKLLKAPYIEPYYI